MNAHKLLALVALFTVPAIITGCDCGPGPATGTKLVFTAQPQGGQAGVPFTPAVQVAITDDSGNVVTGATAQVTLALNDNPGGDALGGTLTQTAVEGIAVFSDLTLTKVASGYTLKATSNNLTEAVSSAFDITPGPPAALAFGQAPSDADSGAAIAPPMTVLLVDAFGNQTTAVAAITIAIGTGPAGAALGGTTTVTSVAGVATFSDLTLDLEGSYTLTATSGALPALTSPAFTIRPGPPASMAFTVQPTSLSPGTAISPAVQVAILDAFGNQTASTAAVTIALANNPGGSTLSGTLTQAAVAGTATFANLSLDKVGVGYTLSASSAGLASATSAGFDIVSTAAPTQLVFRVHPSSADAGASIAPAVEVELQDAFGNQTNSTATVTVAIRTNPSGGTLSGTLSVSAVAGLATFGNLSIDKAGVGYTLQASSAGLPTVPSNGFDIRPGPAAALVFAQQPTNAAAGALLSPAVQVAIVDAFGNQTSSTATVTVALGTNPSGGTLSGTLTRTAVAGVATFSNLSVDRSGTGYTLQATSAGLTGAISAPFDITAGPASRLTFTVQPSNTAAGAAISPAVQVSITDASGNVVTSSSATVTVTLGTNPSGGTLSGSTVIAASAGVATFSGLNVDKAGAGYTLSAASAGLAGATSSAFNITAAGADHLAFTVQPSSGVAGASPGPVQVSVQDVFGNTVTSSTASVTLTIGNNPGGGTLSGTTTVSAVNGVATFTTLSINKAGTGYTLAAASAGLTGATSNPFNITAAAAASLAYVQQPTNAGAGATIAPPVTVAIVDAFGNQTTSTATVTVAIGANPGGGTLSGSTSQAAVAGVATFSNLSINAAGAGYTLQASSPGLTSATSNAFSIVPASGGQLVFITPSRTITAGACPGAANAITVQLQDVFGNPVNAPAGGQAFTAASTSTGVVTWYADSTCSVVASGGAFTIAAGTSSVNLYYTDTRAGGPFVSLSNPAGLTNPTPQQHTIVPGAANKLAFTGQPSSWVAGTSPGPVRVSVQDVFGNTVTSSTATVTLSIGANPGGGTLSGTTIVVAVAGVATFSNLSIDRVGTGYTLVATSPGLISATTNPFNVAPGPASQLAFTVQPLSAVAGAAISPAVQVAIRDAFGNIVTSSTASVTITIGNNPVGGTLSGTTTVAASSGVASFSNLSINAPGTGYTLQASSAGLTSATTNAFNVTNGAATRLAFGQQPSNAVVGATISPAVRVLVQDAVGNTVVTSTATVTLAIGNNPGGGTLGGTTSVAAVAGVATFSNLSINAAGTGYTLQASSPGLVSATSNAFNITGGLATRLGFITQPTSGVAGAVFAPAIRVAVQDAFGNTVVTSTATVTLAIGTNPGGGTLSGTLTRAAVAGVATFDDLSIDRTGAGYTLTAASAGLTSATSPAFNITAGTANRLAFTALPSSGVAGAALAPAVRVTVQDALGNTVTGSTATVTLAIGTNPGGGTLSGTTIVAATAGVATFSALSIDKAGTGYTLVASSPGLISATSNPFNITAAAPSQLAFTVQPSNAAAGAAIAPAVQVSILDAFGNLTGSTATVTVAIGTNPGGGTLGGTTTAAAVAGIATFSTLSINAAGTGYTLQASSAGLTSATSIAFNIGSAGGMLVFITPPRTITAGSCPGAARVITVQLQDIFGSPVNAPAGGQAFMVASSSTGAVNWYTDSACTTVAAGAAFTIAAGTNLVNIFYTDTKAGGPFVSLSNSDGLTNPTPQQHTIVPNAANKLTFAPGQPSNGTAGGAISPAVQVSVQDVFGNTVTSSTATVTVAIGNNPSGGTLSGTTIQVASSGVVTFSNLSIDRPGVGYTLIATSPGLISGISDPFDISAGPASRLAFGQQPTSAVVSATISPAVTVLVQDALGNTVTGSTATVTMAIGTNPGGGTLGGTTSAAAVAGVATFSTLSINAAGTGYTLQASSAGLTSATSNAFNITNAAVGLTYTDPPAGGRIRLVRNAASTSTTVVLDLVAAVPLTGFLVGFNLPLDTTRVQANPTLQTPGTALPAGSAPVAAKAVLPATGPLANVLVSGQSQKAAGAGAAPANSSVPAGAVFYTLRLDLRTGAPTGVVFDGAALGSLFAGNMRDRAGTDVAVSTDFRIGRLDVN